MRLGFACTDRELLDALAVLVDVLDPIPESLVAWAWSALAERTDEAAVRLLSDSARGGARRLTFTGLALRLDRVDGGSSVTGSAPGAAVAVVRWQGDEVAAAVGPDGWFHVERVPSGPVRCVLRGAGRDRATPWFVA